MFAANFQGRTCSSKSRPQRNGSYIFPHLFARFVWAFFKIKLRYESLSAIPNMTKGRSCQNLFEKYRTCKQNEEFQANMHTLRGNKL